MALTDSTPLAKSTERARSHVNRTVSNEAVAVLFDEMAELLAIRGEGQFRTRAYQRAAQLIRSLPQPLHAMHGPNAFDEMPGIGPDLAGKIQEILASGKFQALEALRQQVPEGLRDLLRLPALGPVRVRALNKQLGVQNVDDLRKALEAGHLERLRGFGPVLLARLRKALTRQDSLPKRWPWSVAAGYAKSLCEYLASIEGVERVEVAGSYRRGRDTVGDLDVVIGARAGVDLPDALRRYGETRQLSAAGPTLCTAILSNGLHADVRLVRTRSFGSALEYFTGSRDHNIHLRRRARERGLKLNEYGLFRSRDRIGGETEQGIFAALGLPWIPPELREDRGEIEAAERHELPTLIEPGDLRGDLHISPDASGERESLLSVVAAARARGLEYLAVNALSWFDEIDAFNAAHRDFTLLKGAEVDLLEDGRLALPDGTLSRLDVVIATLRRHFDLSEAKQTARVLRALEHPSVSILSLPVGEHEPYPLDLAKVLTAAHARSCAIELNGEPTRFDIRSAKEYAVLVSVAAGTHGLRQARRGWLTAKDVLNTRPIAEVRRLLARARG